MKKSTPALSHQPPKGIDGEKYESLAGLIEPYADGQFAELLEGLCERVIEAFSPHSWDELTPFQRRSLARLDDVQHDPSLRIDLAAGFYEADYELNHVQAWLTMGAVTPRNATLLFFGQNPSKSQSNLPDMGVDFDLMELSFEDAARDGRARSLNDWLILARSRNLNAVGLDGWEACATIAARVTDTAPAQTATPVPVGAESASGYVEPDKAGPLPAVQGLSTKDIAHAFDGVNGWNFERWRKNLSASRWLHPARIALGGAGGAPSVWSPLTLAQLMHDAEKDEQTKEKLMKIFNSRFTLIPALGPWRDEFNEYFATHCAID